MPPQTLPTPPPGYTLDAPSVQPPPGYTLDAPSGGGGAAPTPTTQPLLLRLQNLADSITKGFISMMPGNINPADPEGAPFQMAKYGMPAGAGALKGAGSTANAIGHVLLPDWALHAAGVKTPSMEQQSSYFVPTDTVQKIGRGVEQAAEFLLPGFGEEAATADLIKAAPKLAPLGRIGYNALTSGLVNKAQGGGFGTGAAAGGIAGGVGEGLKAFAPHLAESALNIRKQDRAYGKGGGAIGRAILDETSGFRPGSVAESAQERLDELNPQLNAAADRASVRPNPARLALAPPAEAVPLGETRVPKMPGDLIPAEPFPAENVAQTRVIRNGQGQILPRSERITAFPNENGVMPPGRNPYNGRMLTQRIENLPFTRQGFMAGEGEVLPPVGNQRIGSGVWMRQPEAGEGPLPDLIPNRSASLGPARSVLSGATGTATRQGERTTLGQLQPMVTHLGETIGGNLIPENVTPRELLDLKRGFGNEFIHRWNPETMEGVKGKAAKTYHALGEEFNNTVPEARELNSQIGRLIPIAKRGESAELNASTAQRVAHRFAAHTGALTGAVGGGLFGYERGGIPGAIKGAVTGAVVPEILTNPSFETGIARGFNSPILRRGLLPLGAVGMLQFTRSDRNNANKNKK